MISFKQLTTLNRGEVFKALKKIYSDYKKIDNLQYLRWAQDWKEYDELLFNNPDTVGNAGFTTFLNNKLSGFCSWDPRKSPDQVIVGHNGVLPEFRKNGIGVLQITEMINIFEKAGYKQIFASTGNEIFFEPAQKMYLKCGFKEIDRRIENEFSVIEYRLNL